MRRLSLVVTLLLVGLFSACGSKREVAPTAAVASASSSTLVTVAAPLLASGRITLGKVEKRLPRAERRYPGEVVAGEAGRAEAGVLVGGRIASIEVGVGAVVKKGQALAWVDAPEVGKAAAELLRARARAVVAGKKLARQLALEKEGATSGNAVDEARADALVADADLAAARTLLFQLGAGEPGSEPSALGIRVAVRAPIDGVVVRRTAVLGGAVAPEHALFELSAKERLAVLAYVPEGAEVPAIGTVARLLPRATTGSCEAAVTADLGLIEGASRARTLRIEPKAACGFLVTGGWVEVGFATAAPAVTTAVLVIPAEAVVDLRGVPVVFVLVEEGDKLVFRPKSVRLAPGLGLDAVIEDGLSEGERVAVRGTLLLKGELLRGELE